MVTFWDKNCLSINRVVFLYSVLFCNFYRFHFGFEGETVVLTKIVPGNNLLFYFLTYGNSKVQT